MNPAAPKPVRAKLRKRKSINEILRAAYRRFTRDKLTWRAIETVSR